MFLVTLFHNKLVLFCWASLAGFLFAFIWTQYELTINRSLSYYHISPSQFDYHGQYMEHLRKLGLKSVLLHHNSSREHTEDAWLFHQVPVLCVILSKRLKNSQAVKNTWAKHCNRAIYFGPFDDAQVPVTKVTEKGEWPLLCTSLKTAYKGYGAEFNWTLVVDDETFAVLENVRYLVASLDPQVPYYLGHAFGSFSGQYNVLDAGIVMSNSALAVFENKVRNGCNVESTAWRTSEKILAGIMQNAGIIPQDTRDVARKARFLSLGLDKLLIPGSISAFSHYWTDSVHRSLEGSGCCSDFAITFHGIPHTKMYMMEYLTYRWKPITMQLWRSVYEPDTPKPVSSPASRPVVTKSATGKASVSELNLFRANTAASKSGLVKRDGNKVPPSKKITKKVLLKRQNRVHNKKDYFLNLIYQNLENEAGVENNYV